MCLSVCAADATQTCVFPSLATTELQAQPQRSLSQLCLCVCAPCFLSADLLGPLSLSPSLLFWRLAAFALPPPVRVRVSPFFIGFYCSRRYACRCACSSPLPQHAASSCLLDVVHTATYTRVLSLVLSAICFPHATSCAGRLFSHRTPPPLSLHGLLSVARMCARIWSSVSLALGVHILFVARLLAAVPQLVGPTPSLSPALTHAHTRTHAGRPPQQRRMRAAVSRLRTH